MRCGMTVRRTHAQRPSSAMRPAPSIMHAIAYASFLFEPFSMSELNRNSWAMSCKKLRQSLEVMWRIADTYLDQTGVQKDAAAERVQNATDDARSRAAGIVRLPHAQSDSDPERSRDAEQDSTENGDVIVLLRKTDERQPRTHTKTLERF